MGSVFEKLGRLNFGFVLNFSFFPFLAKWFAIRWIPVSAVLLPIAYLKNILDFKSLL